LNRQNVVNPLGRLEKGKPTVREAGGAAGRGKQKKRRLDCNGSDRAARKPRYPARKGADFCEVLPHERT